MTTKTKSLKPIEIDAQFKYRCPNTNCGSEYWLFLNQVKVKGFKLVCDCGAVYRVRRVEDIKTIYVAKKTKPNQETTEKEQPVPIPDTPDHLKKAYKILEHYGFSNKESVELVTKVYDITGCTDAVLLVKDALKFLGGI